jgi:hypothetical protein
MRLFLLGPVAILTFGVTSAAGAQPSTRRASQEVVRAPGLIPVRDTIRRVGQLRAERATAIDVDDLDVFEGLTSTSTFVLTPRDPFIPNRGYLWFSFAFVHPASTEGPGGYAQSDLDAPMSFTGISVYGVPGRTYVIDVVVEAHCHNNGLGGDGSCEPGPLQFTTGQGPDQPFVPNANGHALFAFTATQGGWHQVTIRATEPRNNYVFFSATVSVLQ